MTQETKSFPKKIIIAVIVTVVIVLLAIGLVSRFSPSDQNSASGRQLTHTVMRQDLRISVTESGNINALESHDIKSEVEGRTTIINIIDEGTYLTEEDVKNGTILVELDASEITENLTQQEITFSSAEAKFTEASEAYDIQLKQNESDISAGKMKVRFGLMDLQKYLGLALANQLIEREQLAADQSQFITTLVAHDELGGEASQKKRELEAAISLADEQLSRTESKLLWTKRLFEQEYASKSEVEGDEFELATNQIDLEKAKTSLELYQRYEFPKETEKLLSDYREAQRELDRTEAKARSEEAQRRAQRNSAEATYKLQKDRLEKLQKQLGACVIRAPASGLVVYASSNDFWARQNRPIELGADIRERQKIIEIPDTSTMGVEIQVHEAWVDKVKPDLKAIITMDAFPDVQMEGTVLTIAPLPDPQGFWQDTGVKAYKTEVRIDGDHDFLRPGMSAKVEIIIDELADVLCVPLQAIATNQDGTKFCYVRDGSDSKQIRVQTGNFNDNFIEITEGLSEEQQVMLVPPRLLQEKSNLRKLKSNDSEESTKQQDGNEGGKTESEK